MSDHNLISNSLFNKGGNNIGRTVKRKAETSENFSWFLSEKWKGGNTRSPSKEKKSRKRNNGKRGDVKKKKKIKEGTSYSIIEQHWKIKDQLESRSTKQTQPSYPWLAIFAKGAEIIDEIGGRRRFRTFVRRYNMKQSQRITLVSYMSKCPHHCMFGMWSSINQHHHPLLPHHPTLLISLNVKPFHSIHAFPTLFLRNEAEEPSIDL